MDVKTVSYRSPEAAWEFTRSLKDTGFAVLKDHPIPSDLIRSVFNEWKAFFASEEKHGFVFDPIRQSGYFPFRSENAKGYSKKDLKEFYHYYPWGVLPQQAQVFTPELYRMLNTLATELLGWVEAQTPDEVRKLFSMPLPQMTQGSEETLLRAIHYPPLSGAEEEGEIRAAAHEDINLITLLVAATEPGLQVKDVRGKWHDVKCDPGTIAVNAGDMLQMASGGYYPSTSHQVVNPSGEAAYKARLSIPLFLHPRKDVRLADGYTAGSYLDERLREIGLK